MHKQTNKMSPDFLVVDLFCGAGGTTSGFAMAGGVAKVIACVNHDPVAIQSHWQNHPEVLHFEEDIRTLDLKALVHCAHYWQQQFPDAKLILWASLECTNFSKAKGGQPRDADSRTLAEHLERYVLALDPDYIQIENVVEFMSWGPLDEKGKPVSRQNGRDWLHWRNSLCAYGYRDEWKQLNSADFGAFTSRNRLFGVFAKADCPIMWPAPTHSKAPGKGGMFGNLKKWNAVRGCLDFQDKGESIFSRKKPLVEKTLERIFAGLVKFVAGGDDSFLSKYYSGHPDSKNISVDGPAGAFTTTDSHAAVFITQRQGGNPDSRNISVDGPARTLTATAGNQDAVFLTKYNSTGQNGKASAGSALEEPCPTVAVQQRLAVTSCEFMYKYYGNGHNLQDVNAPAGTLTTKDRMCTVFVDQQYGNSTPASVEAPAATLTENPKLAMVSCESWLVRYQFNEAGKSLDEPFPTIMTTGKQNALLTCTPAANHYLLNPQYASKGGSIDKPAFTLIARMDKMPPYLVEAEPWVMSTHFGNKGKALNEPAETITANRKWPYLVGAESGSAGIVVYPTDSTTMQKIKFFMVAYGICDIKMRMLKVPELLKIQGFPAEYKLAGTQTDQKKFIGNSVVPHVVEAWAKAMASAFVNQLKQAV